MADITLTGVRKDIEAFQGNEIVIDFTLFDTDGTTPVDLTNYDIRMMVRKAYTQVQSITATVANGKFIKTSAGAGEFRLKLLASDTTSALQFTAESPDVWEGVYDIEIIAASGSVHKPWWGTFTFLRESTR